MKNIVLFCFVVSPLIAMDSPPVDNKKSETIAKMLTMVQPDFEQKYDEVAQLDLSELLKKELEINTLPFGRIVNADFCSVADECILLRKVAVTKPYAPLIAVLFDKWKGLENKWIAQSMLLHAVEAQSIENTKALLKCAVDPSIPGCYFFQNHSLRVLPLEVSLGNVNCAGDTRIIAALFEEYKNRNKDVGQLGVKLLYEAIENYLHSDNANFRMIIYELVDQGINLYAVGEAKTVIVADACIRGKSGMELIKNLARVNDQKIKRRFSTMLMALQSYEKTKTL